MITMITSELLEKLLQKVRGKGVVNLFRLITDRVPHSFFETNNHIWLLRHLDAGKIGIEPKIPVAINFSMSEFNETADWIKRNNLLWGHSGKEMRVAISEGHYWVNVKSGGKIIGFIKIGLGKVFVSDYEQILQFPPNVAFLHEIHVAGEFRGMKIASYLLNETCKFCKQQGYKKVITYVHDWNKASLKSFFNVGFREIKKIYYYKIFGIKFLTANPTDV